MPAVDSAEQADEAIDSALRHKGEPRARPLEELGRLLFTDGNLSISGEQACASCHQAAAAFSGNGGLPDALFPVSLSADGAQLGRRNAPSAMYGAFVPPFRFTVNGTRVSASGGLFWDGRADTLAAQAKLPLLDAREMQMPDAAAVVAAVAQRPYAPLFERVFGEQAFADVAVAFDHVGEAIGAFEQTTRLQPFSSKFDAMLRGEAELSEEEDRGFALFLDPEKGNCAGCHVVPASSADPREHLFTGNAYRNLGVPRNHDIPDNADPDHYDLGLCQQPGLAAKLPPEVTDPQAFVAGLCGQFREPTLRNVARTAPYMHNGVFATLEEVLEFYATRETNPERWYPVNEDGSVEKYDDLPPIFRGNVSSTRVPFDRKPGQEPRFTEAEADAMIAFLHTLSDGYDGPTD